MDFISAVLQLLLINSHLSFIARLIYSPLDYINCLRACYKCMLIVLLFPAADVVLRGNISHNASQLRVNDVVAVNALMCSYNKDGMNFKYVFKKSSGARVNTETDFACTNC